MAYWQEHSLGIAPQSAFGTVNATTNTDQSGYRWIQGDKPKVQLATELVELDLMTGQIGAAPERLPGRRHGTISFSMPLEGFNAAYIADPTHANSQPGTGSSAVVPHWLALVGNILGSKIGAPTDANFWLGTHLSTVVYDAGAVASAASTSEITLDDAPSSGAVHVGNLVATALAASPGSVQFGFVQAKAGQVLTLLDPATRKVDDASANVYATANAWLSAVHGNQLPVSMLYVGEVTEAAMILQDCICTGFKITWESGAVPTIEFTYNFYEYTTDKTRGGLHVPLAHVRIPQIVGANSGQACIAGVATGGLQSCTVEYKTEVAELLAHHATQGISGVVYKKPRINVSLSVPWVSTDAIYDAAGGAANAGSHKWQSALELGTAFKLGVYVGSSLGRLFAFAVPSCRIVAVPQLTDLKGANGYQLTVEAGSYTGDVSDVVGETAVTDPLDAIFKVSVG
jgi:hypothetical protein